MEELGMAAVGCMRVHEGPVNHGANAMELGVLLQGGRDLPCWLPPCGNLSGKGTTGNYVTTDAPMAGISRISCKYHLFSAIVT